MCVCVCVCVYVSVAADTQGARRATFTGPLTAESPKPQALPRPTLLCNSRPKAIMRGACQAGPALSHNHTCTRACVIVSTYMTRSLQMGGNLNVHFNPKGCHDCACVIAGVCLEVKVCNSVTKPPSGVFSLGLHWCFNNAAPLSVLYSEALGCVWCL